MDNNFIYYATITVPGIGESILEGAEDPNIVTNIANKLLLKKYISTYRIGYRGKYAKVFSNIETKLANLVVDSYNYNEKEKLV